MRLINPNKNKKNIPFRVFLRKKIQMLFYLKQIPFLF